MKRNKLIAFIMMILFFVLTTSAMAGEAPSAPSNLHSITHSIGESSTTNIIKVIWTPAIDPDGDLNGYGTKWDNSPDTSLTPKTHDASATSATSSSLADGNWYFHIRAIDNAYNRSETLHLGPFVIDTQPNIISVTPTTGISGSSTNIIIIGTDFIDGAIIKIGDIELNNVEFANAQMLKGTIPLGLESGTYAIQVINPNEKSDSKENIFTIISGNPNSGDINGDNTIDLADAIIGFQVCLGLYSGEISLASDLNGDNRIGLEEAIYALQTALKIRD